MFERKPDVACFAISATANPQVLPRVFDALAVHGLVPERCHTIRGRGAELAIDVQVADLDHATAARVAQRLGRIVDVNDVLIGTKCATP